MVGGTLQQNLEAIKEKLEEKKSWKEKSRLVGITAVGEQINKFPILSTQEAAKGGIPSRFTKLFQSV